ncbi:MAG: sigma 54-interacting transcriptional regulator [Vicinamibacterales bacterium]
MSTITPESDSHDSVAALSNAVIVVGWNGSIIEANHVAGRIFGWSPEELIGLSVEELMPASLREGHVARRDAWAGGERNRKMGEARPFTAVRRDGTELQVEVGLTPGADAEGRPVTTAVIRDVTARERVIAEIGGDRDRLRALMTGAFDLLWEATFTGPDGECTLQFFRDLGPDLGYELGEFPRTFELSRWLAQMPDEDAARFSAVCARARESGGRVMTEYRLRTRTGGVAWFEYHAQPVEFVGGTPVKYLGASRNVTRRKQAEEQLRLANEELRQMKTQLEDENVLLAQEIERVQGFDEIVGASASLHQVLRQVGQVAQSDSSVLITGETGTGKELVAHAIHRSSPRSRAPMVTLNCAALPPTLIESELFGHERGAFTGASVRRVGRFELAHRGTIFLDEIGDLPLDLQAKLLRVLESGDCQRVGASETFNVDVRVVAATNRQLEQEIEKGTFRLDLFYRLSVFPIHLPPLRERREDIPLLVAYLVQKKAARNGKVIDRIPRDVLDELSQYDWPGNVRELENVIERAVILSQGPVLALGGAVRGVSDRRPAGQPDTAPADDRSAWTLEQAERDHILRVCTACGWKIKGPGGAAERLGLNASTLYFRLKKLGITRPGERGQIRR